mgnify:FL=1
MCVSWPVQGRTDVVGRWVRVALVAVRCWARPIALVVVMYGWRGDSELALNGRGISVHSVSERTLTYHRLTVKRLGFSWDEMSLFARILGWLKFVLSSSSSCGVD